MGHMDTHTGSHMEHILEVRHKGVPMSDREKALTRAAGQASFCLRELLPNDPDAQMTVRMLTEALATPAEAGESSDKRAARKERVFTLMAEAAADPGHQQAMRDAAEEGRQAAERAAPAPEYVYCEKCGTSIKVES